LPPGDYQVIGYECRQVFDIDIRQLIAEYRAEILQDQHGQRYTAPFPTHVTKAVQYGNGVKTQAVYLSQYQLIPYQWVQEQFQDQLQLPISAIAPALLYLLHPCSRARVPSLPSIGRPIRS
jgi:transposase